MNIISYANPDVLVETDWLAGRLEDPSIRIVESNEDILLYGLGHIPNAVHIDWRADLNDPVQRDYISPEAFATLAAAQGITPDTTVVFYGDKSNWWAAYALWVFRLFGHDNVKLLNGGRAKWQAEGRPFVRTIPRFASALYPVRSRTKEEDIRAFQIDALTHSEVGRPLIDVRSPGEFSGQITHMPEYPQEGVLRGGHIPGARNIPWKTAANDDGTFKAAGELRKIYVDDLGIDPKEGAVVYCRIGERSSHTWFVLTYLLGFPNVRNYDGSWTEWGNSVRVPIETGS